MISVRGIGKKYRIAQGAKAPYRTLKEELTNSVGRLLGRGSGGERSPKNVEFWAVRDVSFEVARGEVVGIIGRNGAGKSTLLKVLSRIVRPTTGEAELRGRLGSLLEVGTGFHPELTGRENIFLNAAILGMPRTEVVKKFDEIVAFADVEAFLDTPVKRYSSGMYVRLAFAVAAHLEPEILVVDEVLAVGDLAFQKKCLGRMNEVAKEGRTILFVSHNMGAVSALCSRAILLDQGRVAFDGSTGEAISIYSRAGERASSARDLSAIDVPVQATRIEARTLDGRAAAEVPLGQDVELVVEYVVRSPQQDICVALQLSKSGAAILYSYEADLDDSLRFERKPGTYRTTVRVPASALKEGEYEIAILIGLGRENVTDPRATLEFSVVNHVEDFTFKSYRSDRPGMLYMPLKWRLDRLSSEAETSP